MSVGEELVECPLCMEPLEMDDINFYPCTCGYQICRFCWHRIRTDENGLCPACRKQYPEDPAQFKPLTDDELQRIKKERRQKDLQRKQKAAENRKHLANVRVVQKNLVFVVGLSQRLADPEVLKKQEYFGKFGKIHKVVINQSTSYAGAQGPSASAYVTYNRPEDALKAIQAVNNVFVDGRTLKASLGTTKYCSHFLKGTQCMKGDCMYLHELGEEAASFTKDEMQQGKHQEYEQRLADLLINGVTQPNIGNGSAPKPQTQRKKTESPPTVPAQPNPPSTSPIPTSTIQPPSNANRDAWPLLNPGGSAKPERLTNGNKPPTPPNTTQQNHRSEQQTGHNRAPGHHRRKKSDEDMNTDSKPKDVTANGGSPPSSQQQSPRMASIPQTHTPQTAPLAAGRKLPFQQSDSLSLFTNSGGFSSNRNPKPHPQPHNTVETVVPSTEIPDTIPVSSSTDWQEAFGFTSPPTTTSNTWNDDDLGFDPWDESSKALADLIQIETALQPGNTPPPQPGRSLPPGFTPQNIGTFGLAGKTEAAGSKMMGFMHFPGQPTGPTQPQLFNHTVPHPDPTPTNTGTKDRHATNANNDAFNMKDWQDGLRALLPNINISFGGGPAVPPTNTQTRPHQNTKQNTWKSQWMDPAIVTSGNYVSQNTLSESPPHWMKSLQQLTESMDTPNHNHRLPFVQQFPAFRAPTWPPQVQNPPPGFQTQIRPPTSVTEPQKLEGLQ